MSDQKSSKKSSKVGFLGLLKWNSRMISTSIFNLLVTGYVTMYFTNVVKLDPKIVGILMLISKFIDGVTDTVAGFIVDKLNLKGGKGRPYDLFVIPLWICTVLMFSVPTGAAEVLRYVWAFLFYIVANSVCYTFLNAGNLPYLVRAYNEEQVVKQTSFGGILTMLGAVVFNVVFPLVVNTMGYDAGKWRNTVIVISLIGIVIGIVRFLTVKETIDVQDPGNKDGNLKVKDIFYMFKNNKYVMILCLMSLVFNFVVGMGVTVYYYNNVVMAMAVFSIVSLAQMVAIPLMFIFPAMLKKINVVKLMMIGFLVSAAGYFLNFFGGSSPETLRPAVLIVAAVLTGAGTIPSSMLLPLALMECADYSEWNGIPRMEGSMSALSGLMAKIGSAVGGSVMLMLIGAAGYTGELAEAGALPGSAITMIRLLFSIIPGVLFVLTALILVGYDLGSKMPQVRADLEVRRKTVEAEKKAEQTEKQE